MLTGQTYADDDVAAALTAASRALDQVCRRRFWLDAVDQSRYYSPFSSWLLEVDDISTITTLKTDPGGDGVFELTWTANTDYLAEPLNAAADNRPFTLFRVHPSSRYQFPVDYPRSVQIIGKFGWPTVPAEIVEATTILAAALLKRAREAPFGVVALGIDVAARIARNDPTIPGLIAGYIKTTKAVF